MEAGVFFFSASKPPKLEILNQIPCKKTLKHISNQCAFKGVWPKTCTRPAAFYRLGFDARNRREKFSLCYRRTSICCLTWKTSIPLCDLVKTLNPQNRPLLPAGIQYYSTVGKQTLLYSKPVLVECFHGIYDPWIIIFVWAGCYQSSENTVFVQLLVSF